VTNKRLFTGDTNAYWADPLCLVSFFLITLTLLVGIGITNGCGSSAPTPPKFSGNTSVTVLLFNTANDQVTRHWYSLAFAVKGFALHGMATALLQKGDLRFRDLRFWFIREESSDESAESQDCVDFSLFVEHCRSP
jgi:hypothetical protein